MEIFVGLESEFVFWLAIVLCNGCFIYQFMGRRCSDSDPRWDYIFADFWHSNLSSHLIFIVSIQRLFFGLKAFELTEKHFVLYRGIFRRKAVSIPINEIEFIGIEEQTLGAGLSRLFGNVSEKTVESVGKTIAFATESKTSARASLSDTYTHLLILFHDSERAVFYAKQYGIKIKNLLKGTSKNFK
ncbi:PH domain-containing protein [Streptococcus suis]|uniref:PH domain-containing protein n=1 Tax=Streptococcus suis TaxID=1307 RepID=UPI00240DEF63|nr:PH domain-containing protein [Streptococcus suis]WFA75442.1 PH domain-containing protein [Streptococcus suis]